jgi:16S rRNA (guanine966-N2)-methyltransferase
MSFDGQSVLDLYAGSGALGIEALSRGAAHATFVDRSKRAAQAIDENCCALAIPPSLYTIVCEDAKRFLEQSDERFTLMFADPPYQGVAEWKRLIPALLHAACIESGTVCVFEYSAALKLELPQLFQTIAERQWGDTTCLIACRQ